MTTKSPGKSARAAKSTRPGVRKASAKVTVANRRAPNSSSDARPWTVRAGEVGIRVRMYRVGFGDFFLLSLLADQGEPVHIIVDCGVFKGKKQTGDLGSIEAAVADMVQTTGSQVALIVMTHRHADHIAGFARCAATFKKLAVEAVWMPIWESHYSSTAMKFQAELTHTARTLQNHFSALGAAASEGENTARSYMENATGEVGRAAKGSNAAALELLKQGFAAVTPEYYQAGDTPKMPPSLLQVGLTAQILGPPPISDIDLMKLTDLQKGVGQYLVPDDSVAAGSGAPFGPKWQVRPLMVGPESFREWIRPRKPWEPLSIQGANPARTRMQYILEQSQPSAALTAAKQLNSFLNNQSLVILFTFKGKKLLFVGDAQAGNWEHWLFDTDTPDKTASGAIKSTAQQILTSLDFYKVGHHGSGNATPKAVVQAMGMRERKFAAMCSTQADVYGTEDPDDPAKGTEVPREPLLEKLASESALVRSDQISVTVNGKTVKPMVTAALPAGANGARFEQGALWIDCYL